MGSIHDFQDLGGFGAEGSVGFAAGGADPLGLRKVDRLGPPPPRSDFFAGSVSYGVHAREWDHRYF